MTDFGKMVSLYDLFTIAADSSLDPACVVNAKAEIVYANFAFAQLTGFRKRDLARKTIFCDLVKLDACAKHCQITKSLGSGKPYRVDDVLGHLRGEDLRLTLKCTPLYHPDPSKAAHPIGAVIQFRDTTAEVALQEKCRTLSHELEARTAKVTTLESKTRQLQIAMRHQPSRKS